MASLTMVNIGSGNGLLPDGTKPLPEPILMYCQLDLQKKLQWKFNQNLRFCIQQGKSEGFDSWDLPSILT